MRDAQAVLSFVARYKAYDDMTIRHVFVCGPLQGIWWYDHSSRVRWWLVARYLTVLRMLVGGSSQGILTCSQWSLVGILPCFKCLVVARFTAYDRVLNVCCKEFNRCQSKYSPGCHLQSHVMFTLRIKLKYWWLDLTDFVCLLIYEFWLSLWKIALCSVILLLPLLTLSNTQTNTIDDYNLNLDKWSMFGFSCMLSLDLIGIKFVRK